jgi:hypothetical protein
MIGAALRQSGEFLIWIGGILKISFFVLREDIALSDLSIGFYGCNT